MKGRYIVPNMDSFSLQENQIKTYMERFTHPNKGKT